MGSPTTSSFLQAAVQAQGQQHINSVILNQNQTFESATQRPNAPLGALLLNITPVEIS
jgi:hypothetical protein